MYGGPGPEYDDPANCAPEEDQYGSQYGAPYGAPYDHYGSRGSVGRRSIGKRANEYSGLLIDFAFMFKNLKKTYFVLIEISFRCKWFT